MILNYFYHFLLFLLHQIKVNFTISSVFVHIKSIIDHYY